MAKPEHLERLLEGALAWNAWRDENPRTRPDLRQAHLAEAHLCGFDLHGADLRGSSLLGANLTRADLRNADLSETDLRFCNWRRSRLSGAKLREAKGVEEAMLNAAARIEWRKRIPPAQLKRFAFIVAAAALAWAMADHTFPNGVSARAAQPAIDIAATMSEAGLTAWSVEGVAISGGLMRVRLSVATMPEQAYLATLRAACGAIEGRAVTPAVEQIEILQSDGSAGWLFEQTSQCKAVLEAPTDRLALAAASASRPIKPKASPNAER